MRLFIYIDYIDYIAWTHFPLTWGVYITLRGHIFPLLGVYTLRGHIIPLLGVYTLRGHIIPLLGVYQLIVALFATPQTSNQCIPTYSRMYFCLS